MDDLTDIFQVEPASVQAGDASVGLTGDRKLFSEEAFGPKHAEEAFGEPEDEEIEAEDEESEEPEEEQEEEEEEESEEDLLAPEHLDKLIVTKDGTRVSVRQLLAGAYYAPKHFTQISQGLRERERELDEMLTQLERWKERNETLERLDQTFQANPWLAQAVAALWQGDIETAEQLAKNAQRVLPQPAPVRPEAAQPSQEESNAIRLFLTERWNRELSEIKAQHPDVDEDLLWGALQYHTDDQGFPSMKEAFKAVYFDKAAERAREQGRKQAVRQIKRGAKSPSSMKAGAATPSQKKEYKGTPAQRAYQQYLESRSG